MAAPYTANIPAPATPMVDPNTGVVSLAWWAWLSAIFLRTGGSVGAATAIPSTTLPLMDATPAVVGTEARYAHGDHVHPTDTSRASTAGLASEISRATGAETTISTGLAAITANMAAPGVSIARGASPFVYTAPSHGALLVSGGGVVRLEIKANGVTWFNTGSWYGAFPLASGSQARLTYVGSPVLTFIPT